jgi:hypothetical protein
VSAPQDTPSEEELRAAYEAELNRVTTAEMALQAAVSLLNLGARRMGLTVGPEEQQQPPDLEQVRDAIDAVRALLPVLERSLPNESNQLRQALSQLQMAYAREAQGAPVATSPDPSGPAKSPQSEPAQPSTPPGDGDGHAPGPAQSSGRLWVPGS